MGNFCYWCNETIIKITVVVFLLIFIIFIIFVAGISNNFQVIEVNNTALSTKKIEWGIKRGKNHTQPDLGSENLSIINEFNGMAMGSDEYKYVYLTFDNGYEAGYTEKILDVLKENDVKATFFITGQYLKTSEDLIKRMINRHDQENEILKRIAKDDIIFKDAALLCDYTIDSTKDDEILVKEIKEKYYGCLKLAK